MFYIFSRSCDAYIASITIDAFEVHVEFTNDIRFAIECDFSFINWLHQLSYMARYDIIPERVHNDV